jgi:hypothetical protein
MTEIVAEDRQEALDDEALDLRALNLTYRQIGDVMGVDGSTAYRRVKRAVQRRVCELEESPRMSREIELAKLDRLERRMLGEAHKGDKAAVRLVLKMMELRRKYLGNDAMMLPTTDPPGVPRPLEVAIAAPEEIELVDKVFKIVMNETLRRFRQYRRMFTTYEELSDALDEIYAITRREILDDQSWEELVSSMKKPATPGNETQQDATNRNGLHNEPRPDSPAEPSDPPPAEPNPRRSPYCT